KIPIKIKKVKQRKYGVLSKSESFPEDSDLAQELHCDAVKYIQDAAKQNNNQEASEFVLQQAVVTSSEESEENDETNKLNKNTEEEGDISDHSKIYITPMDDDDSQVTPKKNKSHKLLRLKSTDSEGDTDHEDKYSKDKSKKKCVRAKRKILSSDDETSSSESKEESDSSCSSLVFSDDKNTRKKKKISSDDDKEAKSSKKPKKRRRIKLLNTSESSSDVDNSKVVSTSKQSFQDTPSGKGRRNIRKLIIDHKLQDQTRVAAQEEMERRKRVLERQKLA
ncbi:transcriptional regulator ATRX-like, partial [Limulus polyphemus]|uniref:Transcriptional regulator ATRX-like n=1 Tax=Limulus polyphemus TaxID=6850 RepID=A0ABM1BW63_LIMPO